MESSWVILSESGWPGMGKRQPGCLTSCLALRPELLVPNGYLHAAVVIALVDTACGYAPFTDLPSGKRYSWFASK